MNENDDYLYSIKFLFSNIIFELHTYMYTVTFYKTITAWYTTNFYSFFVFVVVVVVVVVVDSCFKYENNFKQFYNNLFTHFVSLVDFSSFTHLINLLIYKV